MDKDEKFEVLMSNAEYVDSFDVRDEEAKANLLEVLDKYGDNKWWLLDNKKLKACVQLYEPILVINFSEFHEGIEEVLGRPVFTHEFGPCIEELRDEVSVVIEEILFLQKEKYQTDLNILEKPSDEFGDKIMIVDIDQQINDNFDDDELS